MTQEKLTAFGQADQLQAELGLTTENGLKIAAIISFAGGIEYYLERALWRLEKLNPKGIKPRTDAKMIGDLIAMLEKLAVARSNSAEKRLLEEWCAAARSAFTIRHNIAHGVPINLGESLAYMRNPRWEGEYRKRAFGDFWTDDHTLNLVREAMAALLRVITFLATDNKDLKEITTPKIQSVLSIARSVLGEFASQTDNSSYEKY